MPALSPGEAGVQSGVFQTLPAVGYPSPEGCFLHLQYTPQLGNAGLLFCFFVGFCDIFSGESSTLFCGRISDDIEAKTARRRLVFGRVQRDAPGHFPRAGLGVVVALGVIYQTPFVALANFEFRVLVVGQSGDRYRDKS